MHKCLYLLESFSGLKDLSHHKRLCNTNYWYDYLFERQNKTMLRNTFIKKQDFVWCQSSHHFVFAHSYGISQEQDTLLKAKSHFFKNCAHENRSDLIIRCRIHTYFVMRFSCNLLPGIGLQIVCMYLLKNYEKMHLLGVH